MFKILDFFMIKGNFLVKEGFKNDAEYKVEMKTSLSVPEDNAKKEVFLNYIGDFKKNEESVVSIELKYLYIIDNDESFVSQEEKKEKYMNFLKPYLESRLSEDVNLILSKIKYPSLPISSFSEAN